MAVDSKNTRVTNISSVDLSMSTITTSSALVSVMFLSMATRVGMMVLLNSSCVALKKISMNTSGGLSMGGRVGVGVRVRVGVGVGVSITVGSSGVSESPDPKPLLGSGVSISTANQINKTELASSKYVSDKKYSYYTHAMFFFFPIDSSMLTARQFL